MRIIARLDIKGENLIKGIHLEGLRVIGPPAEYAMNYYLDGVDELIYMDSVASLYGRNHLADIIQEAARDIFIPITVGGGIRSESDAFNILRSGADKVAVNTAAVFNPQLISRIANKYGSQCMVLSIEARKVGENRWEVLTENGREKTGLDVVAWARQAVEMGAGEILLTSVDMEGTRKGFDFELTNAVTSVVSVPVIASGGFGCAQHLVDVVVSGGASGVAIADAFHYGRVKTKVLREACFQANIPVRKYEKS